MSVQINSFTFSGDYKIIDLIIDSSTPNALNLLKLARKDGAKLISSNFEPKEITIGGMIKGTSVANLEANIDTFKQSTMVIGATLDLDYAGGFRRYIVDCSQCTITRQNFNITYAPFELKYIASDPPFAEEIDSVGGSITLNDLYSFHAMTSGNYGANLTLLGTSKPKPNIKFTLDKPTNLGNISFKNLATNTQMDIYTAWGSGDVLDINTALETVKKNTQDVEYEGVFPEFNLGSNEIQINLTSADSLNQYQVISNGYDAIYANNWSAQSFKIDSTTNYMKVDLLLSKFGSPDLDISLNVRIETDDSNKPSGTLVHPNATATISSAISTSQEWMTVNFTPFAMTSGTVYWIKVTPDTMGGSYANYYKWHSSGIAGSMYSNGDLAYTTNGGVSWTIYTNEDLCFKIYKSVTEDWSIDTQLKYTKRYL